MNALSLNQNETDLLILVDEADNQIGSLQKIDCHLGKGILHRAFSVFLFDGNNRVLMQQRSTYKMLWPGYWTNSCCSHPRLGEATQDAAHRRTLEELGVQCDLQYLYKFVYQAEFGDIGSEYENCSVFAGYFDGKLDINPEEISATRYLTPDELSTDIENNGDIYTPWFKLEWEHIRRQFLAWFTSGRR